MVLIAVFGFFGAMASSPLAGSCATEADKNRCGDQAVAGGDACSCDVECLLRGDCCVDYSTVCHGACPANEKDTFMCKDGTECDPLTHPDAYGCCKNAGGKLKCPSSLPYMCSGINQGVGFTDSYACGDDHCCFASPFMCTHRFVDRSLLQDCPTPAGQKPTICPHNHGSQLSFDPFPLYMGSRVQTYSESANMTIRADGKWAPGGDWQFCPVHDELTTLLCASGESCDILTHELGWSCCQEEGGRHKCPAQWPVMCVAQYCGVGEQEHCCKDNALNCGFDGPIIPARNDSVACLRSNVDSSDAPTDAKTRQCSVRYPVLCEDNTCVRTKKDCSKVQTECPEVPTCGAIGEWAETNVGDVAYAPCGADADGKTLDGVKYRPCLSAFEGGLERVRWGNESLYTCRYPVPKCKAAVAEGGERIPYLPLGAYWSVNKTDCPGDEEGITEYHCVQDAETNETTHEVIPVCDVPCTRKDYCSGNGEASPAVFDFGFQLVDTCLCTCDAQWAGSSCDIQEPIPVPELRPSKEGVSFTLVFRLARPLAKESVENVRAIMIDLLGLGMPGKSDIKSATYATYVFTKSGLSRADARLASKMAEAPQFEDKMASAFVRNFVKYESGALFQKSDVLRASVAKGEGKRKAVWKRIVFVVSVVVTIICVVAIAYLTCSLCSRRRAVEFPDNSEDDEAANDIVRGNSMKALE